ncbi:UNVERIFIED_CONTAM: ABC transporter substrate-binding protein [Mumia flava]|nr:extracellular solute-binding protein [Mumia flava]
MTTRRSRWLASAAALVAMTAFATACGSDDSASGSDDEEITLRVNLFGKFGYADLYKQYEDENPNITIVETAEGDLGAYNTQLQQRIAAGTGAGDIVAIEEGQAVNFLQAADQFVNLQDHGANDLKDQFLPWKFEGATTADGSTTIGLGTDVGGMAMCYRRDLFEEAGLPTDREQVAALWPTWDDYIATGEKYKAAMGDESAFMDSSTNTYNSILMQNAEYTYFDRDDTLVIDSNPAVKDAWDTAVAISDDGLTAKLKAFSPEWNAGFKNGDFATIACPAWMTGYIKDQSGEENAGNWDITTVPGGSGNWGGSWLAVPTQSEHQEEAIELIKFLTSADGQLAAFEAEGNLPSNPTLYDDPALQGATNEYFSDAPVGQIFVEGAAALEPVYLGAQNQPVRDAVENALRSVENGQRSSEEAWDTAVSDAEKAAQS